MKVEGWKYYNHAIIPAIASNEIPDIRPIENGAIWKAGSFKGGRLPCWQDGQQIGIVAMKRTGGM